MLKIFVALLFFTSVARAEMQCSGVFESLDIPVEAHEAQTYWEARRDRYDLFRQVEVSGLTPIQTDGSNNRGTFLAHLGDRTVFVKIPDRETGAREAFQLAALNRLGLGVRLIGVTRVKRRYALVLEHVSGVNSKNMQASGIVSEKSLREMTRQAVRMIRAGFENWDLQFMVSQDRVVMIDPEFLNPVRDREKSELHARRFVYNLGEAWRRKGLLTEHPRP